MVLKVALLLIAPNLLAMWMNLDLNSDDLDKDFSNII
jgi:hypothetical protein